MTQTRLHVDTTQKLAERIAAELETLYEEDGFPVAAFEADEASGTWSVSVYVPEGAQAAVRKTLSEIASRAGIVSAVGEEVLEETGWVEKTLEGLAPVRAGGFVVHGSHDRESVGAGETGILIDAAMAFGTGHHGTTAGCLEMIADSLRHRRFHNTLDLGTGTGVLAIALALKGSQRNLATDIDPVAAAIAAENARINGVAGRVMAITATGFRHREIAARAPYDLVVANILAGPLHQMATDLSAHVAPGGVVILSGLLPGQRARIVARYRDAGLRLEKSRIRDGWLILKLRKP